MESFKLLKSQNSMVPNSLGAAPQTDKSARNGMSLSAFLAVLLTAFFSIDFAAAQDASSPCDYLSHLKEKGTEVQVFDLSVQSKKTDFSIPIRVSLPTEVNPLPCVLMTPNLGTSKQTLEYLSRAWSSHGFAVIVIEHPGSNEAAWKNLPLLKRVQWMEQTASPETRDQHVEDLRAVLLQITAWSTEQGHAIHNRIDLNRIGLFGHAFGSIVTAKWIATDLKNETAAAMLPVEIRAAGFLAPIPATAEEKLLLGQLDRTPSLVVVGKYTETPMRKSRPNSFSDYYNALPRSADRFELLFLEGRHYTFTDTPTRFKRYDRKAEDYELISICTTAFWDAYLNSNPEAKAWLLSDCVFQSDQEDKRWQFDRAD